MICLESNAKLIVTDSGGVQKEAYFHKVPCVTLRDETEWVEPVEAGWNVLVDLSEHQKTNTYIDNMIDFIGERKNINEYGNGSSSKQIVKNITDF